jgi:hypothetical protein
VPEAQGNDHPEREIVRAVRKRGRRTAGGDDHTIVLQASFGTGAMEIIEPLLAASALLMDSGWEAAPLEPEFVSDASKPQPVSVGLPVITPAQAAAAQALRSRRSSKINTRRVLETLRSGSGPVQDTDGTRSPGAKREFIASMMGRATITGTRTSAAFDGGRFVGFVPVAQNLSSRQRRLAAASHVLSTAGEDEQTDTVLGCFSFESDVSRGLRVRSAIDIAPGFQLETDAEYAYAGDTDALIFSIRVRAAAESGQLTVPHASTTIYLIAFPVDRPQALSMRVVAPDGSRFELSPHELEREDAVVGSAIEIRNGTETMTVVYTDRTGAPQPRALPLIRRDEGRGSLCIAFGGALPVGTLAAAGHDAISWEVFDTTGIIVPCGLEDAPLPGILGHRPPSAVRQEIEATGRLPAELAQPGS